MSRNENNKSEKAGERSAHQRKDIALHQPFHRERVCELSPWTMQVCGVEGGWRGVGGRRDKEEKEGPEN